MNTNAKQQILQFLRVNEYIKADTFLRHILKDNPADHEAWAQLGIVASRRGQHNEAIQYHQSAVACNPQSADAHNQLGQAYRNMNMIEEAIDSYHAALNSRPDFPEAYHNLTDTLLSDNRHHELISICRDAIKRLPGNAGLHCKLAVGLEQAHELEEARAEAEKVLSIAPGHARAMLTLAKIEKRSGNLAQARTILEKLRHLELTPPQLSATLVELGNVLDLMGEFSDAFTAYQDSNAAILGMLGQEQPDSTSILGLTNHYRKVFTADFMHGWANAEPDNDVPSPIFLVGFPRSGTTLTEQVIIASGGIVPTDEKTILTSLIRDMPNVLGRSFAYPDDLAGLSSNELTTLRRHYWKLADGMIGTGIGGNRLLDKLPLNIAEVGLIYRLFPAAPVVVVLRDPRDCCLSCFMRSFVPNKAMNNFLTIEGTVCFYAAIMGFWLQLRNLIGGSYLEIHYEDLVEDFEGTAQRLIDYIEGEWSDSVLRFFEHTRERAVRTPSYSDISRPVFSHAVGRWRNYESQLATVLEYLEPFIKEFGYSD